MFVLLPEKQEQRQRLATDCTDGTDQLCILSCWGTTWDEEASIERRRIPKIVSEKIYVIGEPTKFCRSTCISSYAFSWMRRRRWPRINEYAESAVVHYGESGTKSTDNSCTDTYSDSHTATCAAAIHHSG